MISKELSIGQLLAFNTMNGNFLLVISTSIKFVEQFTRVQTATARLTEIIDSTPKNLGDPKKPFAKIPGNADINRADWIVLLEQGKLKIQGSLDDLRSKTGAHLDFLTP